MTDLIKPVRRWGRKILWVAGVCLALLLIAGGYMRTDSFHRWLGAKLVAQLEEATGGKVELGSFHTIPLRAEVDIRDLTIHGREQPGSAPLFHVDQAVAKLQVVSLLSRRFGVENLVLQRPRLHLETYPDGTTNVPEPKSPLSGNTPIEELFNLSIARLELRSGELLWNEHRMPLDFDARDVEGSMARAFFRRHYEGRIRVGKVDSRIEDWRPFSWSADLQFGLTRNRLEVRALNWSSGRERLHFAGEVRDFRDPKGEGKYDGSFDLGEVGSIVREPRLAGGVLELHGDAKGDAKGVSTLGKVTGREFVLRNGEAAVRGSSLAGQFKLDPSRLLIADLQAHALNGTLSGDVDISNWLSPDRSAGTARSKTQTGSVKIRLQDASAGDLATLVATPDLPLDRLRPAANVDGTIETTWTRSTDQAQTSLNLSLGPPPALLAGSLPVTGKIQAVYRSSNDFLDVEDLVLNARSSHLSASGQLGSSTASLRVNASTGNLAEWEPIVSAFRGTAQLPFRIEGPGSFTGSLRGSTRQPAVTGHLQLSNFETITHGIGSGAEQHFHWDSLVCDVTASRESVGASACVVKRNGAEAVFNVQAGLFRGEFTGASPVTGTVALNRTRLEEVLALAGYDYPLSGTLQLNLHVSGTQSDLQGEGNVEVRDAAVYGERLRALRSNLRLRGHWLEFYDLALDYLDGNVEGTFAYNFDNKQFRSQLAGKQFELGNLPKVRDSRFPMNGRVAFTAAGSGTLDEPAIDAQVDLVDLIMNGESEGSFHLSAKTHGAEMTVSGVSQLEYANLQVDGNVRLRGDWPSSLHFRFSQLDIDPLLSNYLRGRITGHSSVAGTFEFQGPLAKPRDWNMTGNLDQFSAEVSNIKVHSDGRVQFRVANNTLQIEQLHIVGDGTDLKANGTVQLSAERVLNLNAAGHLNLRLVQSVYPDLLTTGTMDITARLTGTAAEPHVGGRISIADGGLSFDDLPLALSDVNGTLGFNQDRLEIEQLTAKSGGGSLTLKGYLAYGRMFDFNVTAQGDGVRLRYPPGMSSTANADLRFYGNTSGATLAGDLVVTRFGLSQGFDFGTYVTRNRASSTLPQPGSILNKVRFDVHLTTTPELRMSTSLAKVAGEADLRLRGTMAKPVLLGRADVQEGEIYFNGGKYKLERGDITFTNPVKIEPVLDLAASTRVRDYDIEIRFYGPADKPEALKVTYTSEPPLPQADIIALLALGRTQEESAQAGASQSAFTQEASSALLGQAINATVSSRVQKLFGVSRIKIDPQAPGTATSTTRGPQVTIEQQVSNKLTLTYVQDVAQATQQTIQAELNITRNVSLVAVRDQNGVFAFDIRIRQRKK
jgi:translocation and assembly module TamB